MNQLLHSRLNSARHRNYADGEKQYCDRELESPYCGPLSGITEKCVTWARQVLGQQLHRPHDPLSAASNQLYNWDVCELTTTLRNTTWPTRKFIRR